MKLSILLIGRPAYSNFRAKALLDALQAARPELQIQTIKAHEIYLLDSPDGLKPGEQAQVDSLLAATGPFNLKEGFFVTPRKGTISPWSSKATDIFQNCGLQSVDRVECGQHIEVIDADGNILSVEQLGTALHLLFDRMTEGVYTDLADFFDCPEPSPMRTVPFLQQGPTAFEQANKDWGLALSPEEIRYLVDAYTVLQRDPTDAELVMFSQVNSEHCRHKIFNADWIVDGEKSERSLFSMIRNTHQCAPAGTLVAYSDNSSVFEGWPGRFFEVNQENGQHNYQHQASQLDILCKVETHNHPTAIAPYPGAATGVGGEIRDEGATGIGGRPKAGLAAFMVSHLRLPQKLEPWETAIAPHPERMASPLDIMLTAPIGGAAFGNEFGRPQLCGLFRTFEIVHNDLHRGYHKPIMCAGGLGTIKRIHVAKKEIPPTALIIQLGGPAMKIGLGGGAASSIAAGAQSEALDFDSVQRGNPEMERRCQQVIDACIALGAANPILSIHDIGAGGLSNGLPELVEATGGRFELRAIHNEDRSMSPMEIWCNEAQERYVLGILPDQLARFEALCQRERCPMAVVGSATDDGQLTLSDPHFEDKPIDISMSVLLGKTPKLYKDVCRSQETHAALNTDGMELPEAIERVLRFPAVAKKNFLITIADRSITGMVTRDQMVGPWQTPVADVAVTSSSLDSFTGESMALGERTPMATLNATAAGRMAIGECITNLAASSIENIGKIKLSANWMVAAGEPGEDAKLYDTVKAVGMDLCPALGISIPVGKDSMSMRTSWQDAAGNEHKQVSPLSLVVTGFAAVTDVRKTLTPDLKSDDSTLLLIDLGAGKNRLGASCLAQAYEQLGDDCPDLEDPELFKRFFAAIQELNSQSLISAYHDRSDGGLVTTLIEMAIAGRKGIEILLDLVAVTSETKSIFNLLFSEELGAVIEIDKQNIPAVMAVIAQYQLSECTHLIGRTQANKQVVFSLQQKPIYQADLLDLNRTWSQLSYQMQGLRDHPECAQQEFDSLSDDMAASTRVQPAFDPEASFSISGQHKPKMAILREQGINGHNEMAAAFDRVGFESFDVTMTDLLAKRVDLDQFQGLVACGGFSYGDVLGAGAGWAKSILFNASLRDQFEAFFHREDRFALGVCNGCQMLSQLHSIIPGAQDWPQFKRNRSEQFESRYSTVRINESTSVLLKGMAGSELPIPVAHGEGHASFSLPDSLSKLDKQQQVCLQYIDGHGQPSEHYPYNPNGSAHGITGFTNTDGRVTIMMPHPERLFRSVQMSYRPQDQFTGEAGPWLRLFQNARQFVN